MTDDREALLKSPAAMAAARVALEKLGEAAEALQRLVHGTDPEALHDFRVAVRRLRSTLRNFQGELDDVPKKLRERLREVTRETAPARDAEVLNDYVKDLSARMPAGGRGGITWFRARLKRRRQDADDEIRDNVVPAFGKLERRLEKALTAVLRDAAASEPAYGTALAAIVAEHATAVWEELATYESPADDASGHRARIIMKRLRYLLEPLKDVEPRSAALIAPLKGLQDALGEIHDLQILAGELATAVADAAAERARHQHEQILAPEARTKGKSRKQPSAATAGLLALARVVHEARRERFERFNAEWRATALPEVLKECSALATALAAAAAPAVPAATLNLAPSHSSPGSPSPSTSLTTTPTPVT